MLRAELVSDVRALGLWERQWDELAYLSRRPYCAPALALAWWRHVRPAKAGLRTVLVLDGDDLVGVAPWFVHPSTGMARYRFLGARVLMRIEPVARPGREAEVAEIMASAIANADPRPDIVSFEGIPADSPWPQALARAWPGRRARVHLDVTRPAPILSLSGGSYEHWMEGKSRNFRQQMGRARRRLDARGAEFRLASTAAEAAAGLEAFAALHHDRWRGKGGSGVMTPGVEAMLADAARGLDPGTRFRLWSIEIDGRIISSHLFVAAGGEVAYWLGGFDQAWAKQYPSMLCILAAIEHAWSAGDHRIELGGGGQPYKYRFADEDETLRWMYLIPRQPRALIAEASLLPRRGYRLISRYASTAQRERLKRVFRVAKKQPDEAKS